MGISTNCGMIVGLPYKEFVTALNTREDVENFEEMIDNGELDIGSIYYDSPRDENIVGKWLSEPSVLKEIKEDDNEKFLAVAQELEKQFPNILFKLYLTNYVY